MLGVSIIVVNYNMARFVATAIESALDQTHPHVEVIVVDDGSEDESRDIISSYAKRIRILFLDMNTGQAAALARAWPLARHPVIVFLDADDSLLPNAAETLAGVFTPTTARVQFCLQTIDDSGLPLDHVSPKFPASLDTATIRSELLRTGASPAAQGSGNAYAKWMLERIEEENGFATPARKRMAMDAALEVNAAFLGEVVTLREPLGCYRIHDANVTGHLNVSPSRFIRTIDKFDLKLAYMEERCRAWGVDFDPGAARDRALSVLECRLAAAKLEPASAPDEGALDVFWPAVRACATSKYTLRQKLFRGAWIAAVALLPGSAATRLIRWRFVVFHRPQWVETLLRRGRARQSLVSQQPARAPAEG